MKIHCFLKLNKITAAALAAACLIIFAGCGADVVAPSQTAPAASDSGRQASVVITAQPTATPTGSAGSTPSASQSPVAAATASPPATPTATPEPSAEDKPLSGIVIGLDPGHQGKGNNDPEPVAPGSSEMKPKVTSGTQGVKSKVEEHVVNLNVALKLRDMLEAAGADVVMTRTKANVDISNIERAQLFNDKKVDLGVRIHANGIDDSSVHGAFMLIPKDNPYEAECKKAAQLIIDSYTQETGIKKLSTQVRSDQTGFNWSERPIVNIEMGHMSNPAEDLKITDKSFQTTMARGIYNGIVEYFKQKAK